MTDQLLVDGQHGIYVPQVFASKFNPNHFGVEEFDPDFQCVLMGPDAEYYWESWDALLGKACYTDDHGNKWHLSQENGDLFLVSEAPIFY